MVKFLQELFPWLATLPFTAKFLVSAAVLLIAGAILVLMWTPPTMDVSKATPEPSPSPTPMPGSTPLPTPLSGLTPPRGPTPQPTKPMWPDEKSLDALRRLLVRTSATNRQLLLAIADSEDNGVYPNGLMTQFKLSRNDVIKRTEEMQALQLIETLKLTDLNYRIHDDVWNAVGPNGKELLRSLLRPTR